MSLKSKIEWTGSTWNPTRGCTPISTGCKYCYAKTMANRFRDVRGNAYEHGFDLKLVPYMLLTPVRINKSMEIFVNSMSDLFHEDIPDKFILKIFRVMKYANWHNYQILTKRPERMLSLMQTKLSNYGELPHIWLGVSVEDKKYGVPRIEILKETPTKNKFLSIEPLLEDLGPIDLTGIDWVIVGGESGQQHRPIKAEWVRSLRDQCLNMKIPFFFKQWGGRYPKQNGYLLDGKIYNEFPLLSYLPVPSKDERQKIIEKITSWYPVEIKNKQLIDPSDWKTKAEQCIL